MVEIDRSELKARMVEAEKHMFCQRGVQKDVPYNDREWIDLQICKACQESYCGISEEELQIMADKFGISSRDLVYGTYDERESRRKEHGKV